MALQLRPFAIFRLAIFGTILLFSLIVFALCANFVAHGASSFSTAPGYILAVGLITMLVIGPVITLDFLRKGAASSWVGVELAWLSILNIFWLAAGGTSIVGLVIGVAFSFSFTSTSRYTIDYGQIQAVQALTWLNWLMILGYELTLIAFAVTAYSRGNKQVFKSSVPDTDFLAPKALNNNAPMQQYPQQTGQPQQQPYPQQQYPQQTGGSFAPPQQGYVTPNPTGYAQPQQPQGYPA